MEKQEGKKGDWVEIERVILPAGERSANVPPDTAEVPYVVRIKGFLLQDTRLGENVSIETIIGRRVEGILLAVNPPYGHDFGRPVPELLTIGSELQALLREERT